MGITLVLMTPPSANAPVKALTRTPPHAERGEEDDDQAAMNEFHFWTM
jgi:hypothetical protein